MQLTFAAHTTPLGSMWSTWTEVGLYCLDWEPPESNRPNRSKEADRFRQLLDRYFESGQESFSDVVIDRSGWTEFRCRVYDACRTIAPAATLTYKQLAKLAGNEKANRAVGAAMAQNRVPLVIPCHRVIACGGSLRGFSAPGGLETKQLLLNLEQERSWPIAQHT